jgi:hypothetical protein
MKKGRISMKKFIKTVCCFLILIALATLALAPATAYASPPTEVSGTYAVTKIDVLEIRHANGNTIYKQIEYGDVFGNIAGSYIFERTVIIYKNGTVNVHGIFTISSANILGKTGTYTQRVDARAVAGVIQGQWASMSGTGELANVHAQGTLEGIVGVSGTYSGKIHFDPD